MSEQQQIEVRNRVIRALMKLFDCGYARAAQIYSELNKV